MKKKEKKIVAGLIGECIALQAAQFFVGANDGREVLKKFLYYLDERCLAYIWGFSDGYMQASNIQPADAFSIIEILYQDMFGKSWKTMLDICINKHQTDEEFEKMTMFGGQQAFNFLIKGKAPAGLMKLLMNAVKSR
jgi:hypothetical protein